MKISILVDNNTNIDMYYYGEPGASYYIEEENQKILFDLGYSHIYLENAKKMGIDLSQTTLIIPSHGHDDHIRGLNYAPDFLKGKKILAHPETFGQIICDNKEIGCDFTNETIEKEYRLTLSKEPIKLTDKLWYLGEIPRITTHEAKEPIGEKYINGKLSPDMLLDDTALVYESKNGLFIITGCSHSGICNIIEHAKKITGQTKIEGILGGMHLLELNPATEKTIKKLSEEKINNLYPCHCVSLDVKIEMSKYMKIKNIGVGDIITVE